MKKREDTSLNTTRGCWQRKTKQDPILKNIELSSCRPGTPVKYHTETKMWPFKSTHAPTELSENAPLGPSHSRRSVETRANPAGFPCGIKVLYDCVNATVDICFIHGLAGDREMTWTAPGKSDPWPKTLLPTKFPKARILTFGYDAYVVNKGVAGQNRLAGHAVSLVNDLTAERTRTEQGSCRNLIFVAHSLGGLVCKKALLYSRDNPDTHLRGVYECTKGIIFMGTPHGGSFMARLAKTPLEAFGIFKSVNTSLIEVLTSNNQLLRDIQDQFLLMIRGVRRLNGQPIQVVCFYEELPMDVGYCVVPQDSAILPGYINQSIRANHNDMVKFDSEDDSSFKRVHAELERWIREIEVAAASQDQQRLGQRSQQRQRHQSRRHEEGRYGPARQYFSFTSNQNNNTGVSNQPFGHQTFNGDLHFG